MLFGVGLSAAFFVIGLPLVAVLGTVTAIFLGHHYHTMVTATAAGADRVHWPNDGFVDMLWKPAYVGWLVACATGPAMILGGLLAKKFGVAGLIVPAVCFWLIFPAVQLSSFYASSIWVPFTPVTLRKMAGKSGATLGFYAQSLGVMLFGCVGVALAFFPHRLGWGGIIAGAFAIGASLFVYARLLGRLTFVCSFVGAEERPTESRLPQHTHDVQVERPKKKKPKPPAPKRTRLTTPDPDDGEGYGVNFADDPAPATPEPEKEFVPPKFAWDDEPVTAYEAKAAEVDITVAVDKTIFAVKESEMKLISRDDAPKEPDRAWTAEVWTGLFADPNTGSNYGIAVVILVVDGILAHVMRGFLG